MLLLHHAIIGQKVKINDIHAFGYQVQIANIDDVIRHPEIDVAEPSLGQTLEQRSLSPLKSTFSTETRSGTLTVHTTTGGFTTPGSVTTTNAFTAFVFIGTMI